MSTTEDIIGRDDVNDLEAILSIVNTDADAIVHTVQDNADAIFTWDYEKGARPALNKLYEKAKTRQWNGDDRPRLVDRGRPGGGRRRQRRPGRQRRRLAATLDVSGTPFEKWGDKEWTAARHRDRRTGRSASSCTASRAR